MRILSTVFLFFYFSASSLFAQTVNDIPIKDLNVEYVQIVGTAKLMSNKVKIEIDFGQENKLFSSNHDTMVKDENGKKMVFQSMIDALNFMHSNGYEFQSANVFTIGNQNIYHFMLRKAKG
ncbi:MAG: hypothetical protein KAT78_04150 [Flavobacteriaceae bacterium]|nr:hypothetical protein [Flavobacteriaceae bacterium]